MGERVRLSPPVAKALNAYSRQLGLNQSQVASLAISDWLTQRVPNLGTLCPATSPTAPETPPKPPGVPKVGTDWDTLAGQTGHTLGHGGEGGGLYGAPQKPSGESETQTQNQSQKSAPKRKGPARFDASKVEIPITLDTERFRSAWCDFVRHRSEIHKPLTPTATKQRLAELMEWGEERAVVAIRHTIAQGWQGIREPEPSSNGSRPREDDRAEWAKRRNPR